MHFRLNTKKLILSIVALIAVGWILRAFIDVGNNQNYAPEQPIPFSHKIHAGQNQIPCLYCHGGIEKTKHAIIPSMNVCMNCHTVVKADSPYVKKLKQLALQRKEPFQWVKVNDLPDFVRFNHKRHVLKGVACEECHGDVKKMDVTAQDKPLLMGWCLDCHRGKTAPRNILLGDGTVPPGGVAPTNCYTCHH